MFANYFVLGKCRKGSATGFLVVLLLTTEKGNGSLRILFENISSTESATSQQKVFLSSKVSQPAVFAGGIRVHHSVTLH